MAEGGMEMGEMGEAEAPDDVETSFITYRLRILKTYTSWRRHYRSTLDTLKSVSVNGLKGVRLKPGSTKSNLNSKADWLLLQPSTLNLS